MIVKTCNQLLDWRKRRRGHASCVCRRFKSFKSFKSFKRQKLQINQYIVTRIMYRYGVKPVQIWGIMYRYGAIEK